jgi:ketosteroid isomerase-like protein
MAVLVLAGACQGPPAEFTEADRAAIEGILAQEFDAYADVVKRIDADGLVGFFQQSGDLAWAHDGVITRSWTDFSEVARQNWSVFGEVESFSWGDLHIQVLAPNAAVVTTTFDFAATDTAGSPIALTGSFTTVWAETDGEWKIVNAAEIYTPPEPTPEG